MGKKVETTIDKFNGGVTNDPRNPAKNVARMVTNFDVITNAHKMTPYRDSEDGDSGAATSKKQNFCVALRTGTTYSLYALGVKSGAATAEVLYKDLTTGASTDLDDNGWSTPANNQSSSGSTAFNLFVYYKKTGLIYGARAGTSIWTFNPGTPTWNDSERSLTYTNIAQGLVHSKDDILYIPYDNKIAKNDNGSWTDAVLTLPTHFKINSICEYGNYLAIACSHLSGVGNSVVFLWDRDSSLATLSESIDWGEGELYVLEQVQGILLGISLSGNSTTRLRNRVIFRYYAGGSVATQITELRSTATGTDTTLLKIAKQKIDNRLYFMMVLHFNGIVREGVWSIGRQPDGPYTIVHERTPNNDTALVSGVLYNFFILGDYLFQSYNSNSAFALSKTNDQASYTATSIYESKIFDAGDPSYYKDLIEATVRTEYLPTAGQVILKYRTDQNTSWTTIFTNTTDNSISHTANNIESTGASLPKMYKEIQFRLESTGGAEITGFSFQEDITGRKYDTV